MMKGSNYISLKPRLEDRNFPNIYNTDQQTILWPGNKSLLLPSESVPQAEIEQPVRFKAINKSRASNDTLIS